MKFKMPDTLEGLSYEEISELHDAALAEAQELNKIPDDKITEDESNDLISLIGHLGSISDVKETMEAEQADKADKLAAARAALSSDDEGDGDGDGDADGDADGGDADGDADADAEAKGKEKVEASGKPGAPAKSRKFGSFATKVGKKGSDEEPNGGSDNGDEDESRAKSIKIEASANVPGFNSGAELDFDQLATAYAKRARQFAGGGGRMGKSKGVGDTTYGGVKLSKNMQRYGVATLVKPDNEFTITEKMSAEDQYDLIKKAANERRLGGQGLVAAGGWCAPSDRIYGFLELETPEGLLDLPEINAPRGGIQFTKGPQLGTLLTEANLGFVQTEAQAEAGTVKPIFDITCPAWTDVRMDAVGYAIRAGLLTDAAYPELLRRYLSLGLIVHARRLNKLAIDRISAMIGAATVFAPVGSATVYSAISDFLAAVELNAMRVRETYAMGLNATVEGVFPIWVLAVLRSDISRRTGISEFNVTDQQIIQWLAARHVKANFVRDYQPINNGLANTAGGTAAWTRFPDKVEFMLYPAGSYVRLATDVIDLDTVYDTDNLTKNQFLAAFFEEGFGIANTGAAGVKVSVGLANVNGYSGGAFIGGGTGVNF